MSIVLAKISKVNYDAGNADLVIEDRNKQVIKAVPFLSSSYDLPDVGDQVFADLEIKRGRIDRGVILGRFYSKKNPPGNGGKGVFIKTFSDGASIKYDPATKTLTIDADKVVVNDLEARDIKARDIHAHSVTTEV